VKIVLDTTILVRANERSFGLARDLLTNIVESEHTLLFSNEMLHELRGSFAIRVCRPSSTCRKRRSSIYVRFLRQSSEIIALDPLVVAPICDANDVIVMQTAIVGEAEVLCTRDDDFFAQPASDYLRKMGITVLGDISLMHRLRS
jgi:putative PIN family toxin of toxin-antitoxin system